MKDKKEITKKNFETALKNILDHRVIIIDTREQNYHHIENYFKSIKIKVVRSKLEFGDYGFGLLENDYTKKMMINDFAFERKFGIEELTKNLGGGRERFVNEFERRSKEEIKIKRKIDMYLVIEKLPKAYHCNDCGNTYSLTQLGKRKNSCECGNVFGGISSIYLEMLNGSKDNKRKNGWSYLFEDLYFSIKQEKYSIPGTGYESKIHPNTFIGSMLAFGIKFNLKIEYIPKLFMGEYLDLLTKYHLRNRIKKSLKS